MPNMTSESMSRSTREALWLSIARVRRSLLPGVAVACGIFLAVFVVYYGVFPHPVVGTDHEQKQFVVLAQSFLDGRVDMGQAPEWQTDMVVRENGKFLYNPPAPAFLLLPFVSIWGTGFSQAYFSMALGAVNVVLFWVLLRTLKCRGSTQLLLVPFFAFGTVHFSAATIGSVWFYSHVAAVFYLFIAVIAVLRRWPAVIPGLFLGLAFLSRFQTVLAAPFFLYLLFFDRQRPILNVALFCAGLAPAIAFALWYNDVRFGSPFDSGYADLYSYYIYGGQSDSYSFYRPLFPGSPHFRLFDIRNIPLHLYTIFLMPPQYVPRDWSVFRPSPYGLSVLLQSPAFIYAALVKRRTVLKPLCWIAIGLIAIPIVTYYSQGWVQFGYRFLLDFAPFLLILTALGFEDTRSTKWKVLLVGVSIVANLWGKYWVSEFGWGQ